MPTIQSVVAGRRSPGGDARAGRGPWHGRLTRAVLPLLSVLVFGVLWQLAAASGGLEPDLRVVSYPTTVWKAFADVSTTHDGVRGDAGYLLWEHLYMTLRRRVLVGVVIGVVVGVLLGLVMGSIGWVPSVLEPWLTLLRALPPLAYFFLLPSGWESTRRRRSRCSRWPHCPGRRGHHGRGARRSGRIAGSRKGSRCVPAPGHR